MRVGQQQDLRLQQKLSLAAQQSLRLLAMDTIALWETVQNEFLINPLLEMESTTPRAPTEFRFLDACTFTNATPAAHDDDEPAFDIPDERALTIRQYLIDQLPFSLLSKTEFLLLQYLIDAIDEDTGYLSTGAEALSRASGRPVPEVNKCLAILRGLEPSGIAAENLAACIETQLRARGEWDAASAQVVALLPEVARGNLRRIAEQTGLSPACVRVCVERIKSCEPRPVQGFSGRGSAYLLPDLTFLCTETGGWTARINDGWADGLRISKLYRYYLDHATDGETRGYLAGNLARAQALIHAIEQRRKTLLLIAEQILLRQRAYLAQSGCPAVLRMSDVAEAVGVHVSTVSRAIKDKYVETPFGTVPLRQFFVPGVGGEEGEKHSAASVQERIKALIARENPASPLSDNRLAALLEQEGVPVARRTVAKYRAELGLPGAAERKHIENNPIKAIPLKNGWRRTL